MRNAVVGQALDEQGRPVADAEVTVRYQSNPGGVSISRSSRTDRQGRYRIDLRQPPGVWTVHAKARLMVDGAALTVDLVSDNASPFAGHAGAVRNFRLRFAEQTADDPYGVGGMLVVNSAIGDYTPLAEVTVTLHPVGGGAPVERSLRNTGEGWVLTGLRPTSYRVTASHRGQPMLVSAALTPQRDYNWKPEYVGGFERTGPGIYQMRIEVRSR
ncbi:MAG TPA: carboxypeptidase-like regulatory domain-containing protein [Sphingopyxis sp.]|uniref:carboxypeptidase-like regulatory domain-containing protein n=1 Tax=Sphingopyxis sp. TaxID=1908224 RepID=UPI002C952849|nr:carboxypeptidase-like regulatory domain-containing protein [Sphingopyxis sp.]HWW57051.1 carboxypeptidase-like regulatory domain-containing protein [Sphingopyxis sp.]